jgi:hypothetical protein
MPDPDLLLQFVLAMLTPVLATGLPDPAHARHAALQAIEAYHARAPHELVSIAQIVGLALTALDDLRLSMGVDLSLSMKLRLRGNATALSRTSQRTTEALEKARKTAAEDQEQWAEWAEPTPAMEPPAPPQDHPPAPQGSDTPPPEAPIPTPLTQRQQNRQIWAGAMTRAAADLRARTGRVTSKQRAADQLWVQVLTDVARDLHHPTPPGLSKSDLLRTTLMAGGGEVPNGYAPTRQASGLVNATSAPGKSGGKPAANAANAVG